MSQTDYLWPPAPTPSLPVRGTAARLPVRRIFCVGRNYQGHAIEMGTPIDKTTMRPFYFIKDAGSLVETSAGKPARVPYPPGTANYHHEIELVVAIGAEGFEVSAADADRLVYGYAAGLDMTRRDLQKLCQGQGRPWDLGKNFEHGAVCGEIVPAAGLGLLDKGAITLQVNGQSRQSGDLSMLIWNIRELIADLSCFYHLQPGDLIYTGTPEGVGAVQPGDRLSGHIEGIGDIELEIGEPE
ncbi:fumarylacetoacetate hydrolase family protein [Thauera sp. Sel9]|uniref:fumarylacetoacetate hydrolase family protein n=1 Tax=Thauera sp. Sel9 TaxID=2974299 RepID=UPI0021E19DB8|nr:fumarylacetoacetate hydrolase family protein [Thauera sp. Sel9]MCV2216425.1 fumarylacetoacetate hydrolase family protein [Thauera sp. Sel9]